MRRGMYKANELASGCYSSRNERVVVAHQLSHRTRRHVGVFLRALLPLSGSNGFRQLRGGQKMLARD